MKMETEEEKKERYGLPSYDIKKLLDDEFKIANPSELLKEH